MWGGDYHAFPLKGKGVRNSAMDQDGLAARITHAGDEVWTTLNLPGEGLECLPPEIGNLTGLEAC